MTIDWFVAFTPLAAAVIGLLFLFVGCKSFTAEPEAPPANPDPAPAPSPAPTPTPVPPPVPAPKPTILQLNPSANLQFIATGLPNKPVTKIDVTWTLTEHLKPATPTLTRAGSIVKSTGGPIDPTDMTAMFVQELDDSIVGTRNRLRCACVVTVTTLAGVNETINPSPEDVILNKNGINKFWIEPEPPANPNNPTRRFKVIYDAAGK